MIKRRNIAVLGSTGSIGKNTLDVIRRHPDKFKVTLLTAYSSTVLLERQIREFKPCAVACSSKSIVALRRKIGGGVHFFDVDQDLSDLVHRKDIDVVVLAVTGAAGLKPFYAAVQAGKVVAPANKEALVMAGDIIMSEARRKKASVIPVDSEQSAIFQSLLGHNREDLKCVHLTASGGALRNVPFSKHAALTVNDVLAHPRWDMGPKITVDSATLMNKGLEVIEAQKLFNLSADQIQVVIHPEAIVHSLVEYCDGSFLAQLSTTDMRIPIQYALTYPDRMPLKLKRLDLVKLGALTFDTPDMKKFPALRLACHVAKKGGSFPAVMNAANEIAVEAFLAQKIKFTSIYQIVEKVVRSHKGIEKFSIKEILEIDVWARDHAREVQGKVL